MKVEQFVMVYEVGQDRLRALLPNDFHSLRPVLRINAEIRQTTQHIYGIKHSCRRLWKTRLAKYSTLG